MRSMRFVVGVALSVVVGWSCSQKARERPPYTDLSCEGDECSVQGGAPVGVPGGGNGNDTEDETTDVVTSADETAGASSGQDSTGSAGADDLVVLDPREATDIQRTEGAAIGRPYALYAWPDQDVPVWKATGLEAVSVPVEASGQWFLVVITDASEALDPTWLPTLSWQKPSADPVIVPVFRNQFWSDLAAGLAVTPTTLDPDASQVLVQVKDMAGEPRLGVSAEVTTGAIAYGNGGSASDVLTETDDSGVLVWINAPAGAGTTLTLRSDSDSWSVVIPTRASAVTVAAVAR